MWCVPGIYAAAVSNSAGGVRAFGFPRRSGGGVSATAKFSTGWIAVCASMMFAQEGKKKRQKRVSGRKGEAIARIVGKEERGEES